MHVILTVDVESYTGNYAREVFAEGRGLTYMLEVCRRYGVRGTYFVEALGATRWGRDTVAQICRLILAHGHEVGLHVHPVVARLDGFSDRWDVLWEYDAATQTRLLREGREILEACGVPELVSFRAGDLAADENTLAAMSATGFPIGSNRDLDRKCSTRSRLNESFAVRGDIARANGVTDVPVTAFRSPLPRLDGSYRHLEIAAMGSAEMHQGLLKMAREGYACACILAHPGEFYRYNRGRLRVVAKNCRRYERLLQFMSETRELTPVTLAEAARNWSGTHRQPHEIMLRRATTMARVVEQVADRLRGRCGW